jgi:hypothetical protein
VTVPRVNGPLAVGTVAVPSNVEYLTETVAVASVPSVTASTYPRPAVPVIDPSVSAIRTIRTSAASYVVAPAVVAPVEVKKPAVKKSKVAKKVVKRAKGR